MDEATRDKRRQKIGFRVEGVGHTQGSQARTEARFRDKGSDMQ